MTEIRINYADLLKIRRDKNTALYYEESGAGYSLWVSSDNFNLFCEIEKNSPDAIDFETYRKSHANKIIKRSPDTIQTHDFSDKTTWTFGTSNSLYLVRPTDGQVIILHESKLTFDKDMDFSPDKMYMVLWIAQAANCPAFDETNKTRTQFSTPAWVPGISAGWTTKNALQDAGGMTKQYHLDNQEVTHHIYVDAAGTPQYIAVVHEYTSIPDLKAKAKHETHGTVTEAFYPYIQPVHLRSSKNERLEIYSDTDTEHVSPNNQPSRAILYTEVVNEF